MKQAAVKEPYHQGDKTQGTGLVTKNVIQEELMNCSRNRRTTGRFLQYICVIALMFVALSARAASVFYLDQSNRLPDGTNYLSVQLTENGLGGVDFLVQTLSPLNSIAGSNFGIQKFGFSFLDDTWGEISNLPDGWRVRSNRRMDGFGKFDIRLQGRGNARTDSLSFTVNGVTISDFESLMSARVAGFEWCRLDDEQRHRKCGGRDCATSAYFAGTMPEAEVPAPAAVWLFGSGLVGLAGVVRRRRHEVKQVKMFYLNLMQLILTLEEILK